MVISLNRSAFAYPLLPGTSPSGEASGPRPKSFMISTPSITLCRVPLPCVTPIPISGVRRAPKTVMDGERSEVFSLLSKFISKFTSYANLTFRPPLVSVSPASGTSSSLPAAQGIPVPRRFTASSRTAHGSAYRAILIVVQSFIMSFLRQEIYDIGKHLVRKAPDALH